MKETFVSPVLLVVEYFDALVRRIDIYTEHMLERFARSDLLVASSASVETNVTDYLNGVRQRMLDEIRKEENATLERYESNRRHLVRSRSSQAIGQPGSSIEWYKKQLFERNHCVLLKIDSYGDTASNRIFVSAALYRLHLVIFDFYLSQDDIAALKYLKQLYFPSIYTFFFIFILCFPFRIFIIGSLDFDEDNETGNTSFTIEKGLELNSVSRFHFYTMFYFRRKYLK